ncbi:hypothetical protein RchiOBHm_Chr7g0229411 [Rosa chinensis]|uniref:Uncharacterized protein n=1 Tax=Rosa chinensis TaxID=74649 RepID=A0A2P6PF45_ROSCH|nr:hypothetical protein RchiOBHm_Chr7g0229411 [Rosa chinensis]
MNEETKNVVHSIRYGLCTLYLQFNDRRREEGNIWYYERRRDHFAVW